jgi:hypothetical protein
MVTGSQPRTSSVAHRSGHSLTILVLSCGLGLVAAEAGGQRTFRSNCGEVTIPPDAAASGFICLSFCSGTGPRTVSCSVPGGSNGPSPALKPISDVEAVGIWVRGKGISVAEFAEALRRVSGWQVDCDEDVRESLLRGLEWTGTWHQFEGLRLRLRGGGGAVLRLNDQARRFGIARQE